MRIVLIIFIITLTFCQKSFSQNVVPLLERNITLTITNERLDVALKKIAAQGGFDFSYNSKIIEGDKIISYSFSNKTVRQILDQIFLGTIEYKAKSKHIILTKAKLSGKNDSGETLKGYVIDEATGKRIENATVYEPVTLSSAITNSYGYFEIKMSKPPEELKLIVNKQNYTDTLVNVKPKRGRLLNIPIKIDKEKIHVQADSLKHKIKRFWKNQIMNPKNPSLVNVTDTFYRVAQFSLVPYLGTNHKLSGNVINDYSFNLLGGYSLGTKKVELGGIFNLARGDVEYAQVAGVFNTVGGKMRGGQIAGVFNANYNGIEGGQIAGVANINWNTSRYLSIAGVMNFTRIRSEGVHLAGVGNFTLGKQIGPHTAGLFNFSTSDAGPAQIAGAFNFTAGNFKGAQVGGAFNFIAGDLRGSQLSGVFNFTAGNVRGSQISSTLNFAGRTIKGNQIGLLNFAHKVRGSQVGLLNITDSINGVPVGLMSIVLKGYHKVELSADEIFYSNVALRTGVRQFYNILTVGAKPDTFEKDSTFWTFGYGIGTAPKISKWLFFNIDVTANQIVDGKKIDNVNLLNKLYLGFDVQIFKRLSLTFGTTLNAHVSEKQGDKTSSLFTNYQPHIFYEKDTNDHHIGMWWGGKVGLKFF